jgi:hypothetical protein
MNTKRYVLGSLAVFVFIFVFEWVLHGQILAGLYEQTMEVWRPKEGMADYMGWMVAGQLLFAFIFGYIFLKGYENKGVGEGFRYGILIGLLFAPAQLIWYAVLPIPLTLAIGWLGGAIIEMALAGVVLAAVYRK